MRTTIPCPESSRNKEFPRIGKLIERIKVNSICREVRDGRPVWVKTRRKISAPLMACANSFFALAGTPMRAISEIGAWQNWEVESFQRLHSGEGLGAFRDGDFSVAADEAPGINLTKPLDSDTLTPRMSAAAARELRRAHLLRCGYFPGGWSHGDPHIGNFIYDEAEDRARLIDFELIHHRALGAEERHCDDLLVFLQDMMGRIGERSWLPCSAAFLEAYDRPQITGLLVEKLRLPAARAARLWWRVRTTFLPRRQLQARIASLQEAALTSRPAARETLGRDERSAAVPVEENTFYENRSRVFRRSRHVSASGLASGDL